MAWRPYENLIDGKLDNRTPGKVTGWMRFLRTGAEPLRVVFDLTEDFHEDVRGRVIRLQNIRPADTADSMKGFSEVQKGEAGDITAGLSPGPWSQEIADRLMQQHELAWEEQGLPQAERDRLRQAHVEYYRGEIAAGNPYHPYVDYPYIEWYSEANGRVVLELDPDQVVVVDGKESPQPKTPQELHASHRKREHAMERFLEQLVEHLAKKEKGEDADGARAR